MELFENSHNINIPTKIETITIIFQSIFGRENGSKFSPGHSSELRLTMSFQVADTALQASFEDIDRLEKILHKSSGGR